MNNEIDEKIKGLCDWIKSCLDDGAWKEGMSIHALKRVFANNSRWSINKTIKALDKHNIDLKDYIKLLTETLEVHHKKDRRALDTNNEYLHDLKKVLRKRSHILSHKNDFEGLDKEFYTASVQELKRWQKKYLRITNRDFIDFIHAKTDLPYKKRTIENLYDPSKESIFYIKEIERIQNMYVDLNRRGCLSLEDFKQFVLTYELSILKDYEIENALKHLG